MGSWILRNAPDEATALEAGTAKTTPTYRRLRREYLAEIHRLLKTTGDKRGQGFHMVVSRKAGRFVARWTKKK